MARELDYRNEAERQTRFRDSVQVAGLVVPRVFTELTTARVLTQTWENGVPLSQAAAWPDDARSEIGRILLGTLLSSMIGVGEVHGDPHAGNYAFRKRPDGSPEVVLMDFGCTVPVARAERLALLRTIIAVREGEDLNALNAFAAMGFDAEKLALISGALGTLTQQIHELAAGMSWWQVMHEVLPPALMAEARGMAIPEVSPDTAARARQLISSVRLADHLRVKVSQGDESLVDMSMPAEAVLQLEELIPEETLVYLRESSDWDLPAIMEDIRSRGVSPREIMRFEKGQKRYRIWLS